MRNINLNRNLCNDDNLFQLSHFQSLKRQYIYNQMDYNAHLIVKQFFWIFRIIKGDTFAINYMWNRLHPNEATGKFFTYNFPYSIAFCETI